MGFPDQQKSWPVPLKVDIPILTCIFFTFNWLTLTSEMHFVKFHPEVASCLLFRGKRKYAPLGMRLLWKHIRNYFLVYHLISHFLLYLQNYNEFKAEILDLQSEKYGLSFDIKKYTTSGWALGDENVIGIRAFKDYIQGCIWLFEQAWKLRILSNKRHQICTKRTHFPTHILSTGLNIYQALDNLFNFLFINLLHAGDQIFTLRSQ